MFSISYLEADDDDELFNENGFLITDYGEGITPAGLCF